MKISEPGEEFVLKAEESTEVTKTVSVAIHDFTKKIDDVENKKKPIESPMFKVGEKEFCLAIYPEGKSSEGSTHIVVYLNNLNEEKIKASYIFKHESGVKKVLNNKELKAGKGKGHGSHFLSHEAYKKWAEDHGDVFKVEAEITHVEEGNPAPEWESNPRMRYVLYSVKLELDASSLQNFNKTTPKKEKNPQTTQIFLSFMPKLYEKYLIWPFFSASSEI